MSDPGEEIGKEAASTAVKMLLGPIAKVGSDLVAGVVGDRVERCRKSKVAWQELNREAAAERARAILDERKITITEDIRPEHIDEILEGAKGVSAPEIRELFAQLLASAVDPSKKDQYRPEFVEIARNLQPLDALVLKTLAAQNINPSEVLRYLGGITKSGEDDLVLAIKNLARLDCVEPQPNTRVERNTLTTALGRRFIAFVS